LLATGGCRPDDGGKLATELGHTLEPPVPSLFTFRCDAVWLRGLAGVAVETVEVSVPGTKLRERGPILVTHTGLSGPVILRLSAWGARELHGMNYRFPLQIHWLPGRDVAAELEEKRRDQGAKLVTNTPLPPLPARLWERLVDSGELRWSKLSRTEQQQLIQRVIRTELVVNGKDLNKEEFVTCGGVRLREVDFKTMESRIYPGLYFAGELLDMDGITGGFNFQAAWTTGWLAGRAMAER
jgi:predicted Rossmann fold flavoprotein